TLMRSADDWFAPVERLWEQYRKSVDLSLWQRLNFQQGVLMQSPAPGHLVIYNASGSNLASAVIESATLPLINGVQPQSLVLDHTLYWYRASSADEAHYLSALLNAPCVDAAIKPYQTYGTMGARHVHRRPFEVCAMAPFDAGNADHLRLAALSREAHAMVAALGAGLAGGGVVAARKLARQAAHTAIVEIDAIAQRLLGLPGVASSDTGETAGDAAIEADDGE
ncbi:MAG: hypothetical protein ABI068_12100, partial [Ktedonobacterales bacterium]